MVGERHGGTSRSIEGQDGRSVRLIVGWMKGARLARRGPGRVAIEDVARGLPRGLP